MALTREQILSADDLPRTRVDVPEWAPSGTDPKESFVFVRVMTGDELDQYEQLLRKNSDGEKLITFEKVRATTCALATCDESGNRLFTTEDIDALGKKSGPAIKRVFAAIQEANALTKQSEGDAEKN